jgi:hypothetical protein
MSGMLVNMGCVMEYNVVLNDISRVISGYIAILPRYLMKMTVFQKGYVYVRL